MSCGERARAVGRLTIWAALIAAVDQGVKGLVVVTLTPLPDKSLILLPGLFSLTYRENSGAAFSLLQNMHSAVLIVLNVLVLVVFLFLIRPYLALRAGRFAAAMVLGGAVGNLIDRLFRVDNSGRHFVVDYLDFHVWPVFNLADAFVVIGVAVLVLLVLRVERAQSIEPVEPDTDPGGTTPT